MLEKKKLKAEMSRVIAAKDELDYLIEQKKEEIKRLQDAVDKQVLAEKTLQEKINNLGE
jgi:hypothetical protein